MVCASTLFIRFDREKNKEFVVVLNVSAGEIRELRVEWVWFKLTQLCNEIGRLTCLVTKSSRVKQITETTVGEGGKPHESKHKLQVFSGPSS